MVLFSGIIPAFAEVTELQLDKTAYAKGDSINARGSVTSDSSGIVTIVLRDPNDKFVLLNQAIIHEDNSFETIIPINQKFQVSGTHNATAFVLNMTAGLTQSFDLVSISVDNNLESIKDASQNYSEIESILEEEIKLFEIDLENDPNMLQNQLDELIKNENQEKLIDAKPKIADFVDITKEPQHYLERYYNEPSYKLWFDRNYPDLTIEEAVGYTGTAKSPIDRSYENIGNTIIPQAEASSFVSSPKYFTNNEDISQVVLVLGGLAILFGSVYGIKRKIDGNSRHISLKKGFIRQKIISSILYSNTNRIIQTRLAKGEISIEEYENLKQKLGINSN